MDTCTKHKRLHDFYQLTPDVVQKMGDDFAADMNAVFDKHLAAGTPFVALAASVSSVEKCLSLCAALEVVQGNEKADEAWKAANEFARNNRSDHRSD